MTRSGDRKAARLLLDEMFSPLIAEKLVERGADVVAVAATPELRAMSDAELFEWDAAAGYRLVTENVKDFARLASNARGAGRPCPRLLFTSSRSFPRSRRNPGPIIAALDSWLATSTDSSEDWLRPP